MEAQKAESSVAAAAHDRWQELIYQRWFDLLLRLSRAPDRSREVRLAADALFGALMREHHGESP